MNALGLFRNCRGEGVDMVFVARFARHEHHTTTVVTPRQFPTSQKILILCRYRPTVD
jgi:hypothetical protein